MRNFLRKVRDSAAAAYLKNRHNVEVMGVKLALHHPSISDRMKYVMWRGYESGDALVASTALSPEDRVLEIGGSIGFMALHCIKNLGISQYCVVEANPSLKNLLEENFALNQCQMPSLIQVAVANEDGEIDFNVNRNFWSSSLLDRSGTSTTVRIPAVTLTTAATMAGFAPNTLIMDIEGAETSLSTSSFAQFEKLIIEFHPKLAGELPTRKLIEGIEMLGFEMKKQVGATRYYKKH